MAYAVRSAGGGGGGTRRGCRQCHCRRTRISYTNESACATVGRRCGGPRTGSRAIGHDVDHDGTGCATSRQRAYPRCERGVSLRSERGGGSISAAHSLDACWRIAAARNLLW
jgi:hypothetical protein